MSRTNLRRVIAACVVALMMIVGASTAANATVIEPKSTIRLTVAPRTDIPVPPVPTGDCITMASVALMVIGIRSGQPLTATGKGSAYMNASQALGLFSTLRAIGTCSEFSAYALADITCRNSRDSWWKPSTMTARVLVWIASGHRTNFC